MLNISDTVFKWGMGLAAVSLGFLPMALRAKEASPVKVEKPESFKGVTQVVIGQFTVAFFTKKVDYDGGGFLAASAQGKAIGHLSGISPAEFQKTTDQVYDDFTNQLAAHGIAVADPAGMMANQYYAKVKHEAQRDERAV